jgi:hypothetical protein
LRLRYEKLWLVVFEVVLAVHPRKKNFTGKVTPTLCSVSFSGGYLELDGVEISGF